MKILTAQQMYAADKATLEKENISSLELMERAATKCFSWLHQRLQGNPIRIFVFCGIGNNGGDGLVIARHLNQHGYNVHCFVVNFSDKRSPDFLSNYDRLKENGVWPTIIKSEDDFPEILSSDVVVDTILGIGLTRSVEGFTSNLIKHINKSKPYTLSIDVPSGMFVDKSNASGDTVIEASHTLTFQQPKLAFYLPSNEKYIYTWEVLDIGLGQEFINSLDTNAQAIEKVDIQKLYKFRNRFSHKGTYGHSLLIGGSFGKIGAITLASKAALKSGSGLVSVYIPKCGYNILQISNPEVMVEVGAENELQYFNYESQPTVIGIGPGMGTLEKTMKGFAKFLKDNALPLVIDADALNLLSMNKKLLEFIPEDSILTPHPKEFERLVGKWKDDFEKVELLKTFSAKYNVIVVLKGAHTIIAKNSELHINTTGNPALATAGSGDVLMGMITGLLAQKYDAFSAAKLGVYLHGLTADIAFDETGCESFIASDILEYLGLAFLSLTSEEEIAENKKPSKSDTDSEGDLLI